MKRSMSELARELAASNRFQSKKDAPAQVTRLATIDPAYVAGSGALPKVIYDGESALTAFALPHNRDYSPVAGDRVKVDFIAGRAIIAYPIKFS